MSNKLPKIFAFCVFCLFLKVYAQPATEGLLAEAQAFFEARQYDRAMQAYEKLYATGYFDEQMLYQMAFACEHLETMPQSIYYLRKAQWEYGNSLTDAKVAQLVQEMGATRFAIATEWSAYHAWIHRNYAWLLLLTAVLLGLAVVLFIGGRGNSRRLLGGIGAATAAMLLALLLVEHSFIAPRQGVIIRNTSFYEQPAYTANSREIPISPGTLVDIKSRHDIWYHVAVGHYECWVPEFALMQL